MYKHVCTTSDNNWFFGGVRFSYPTYHKQLAIFHIRFRCKTVLHLKEGKNGILELLRGFEEGDDVGFFLEGLFVLPVSDEGLVVVLEKGVGAGGGGDADASDVKEEVGGIGQGAKSVDELGADLFDGFGGVGRCRGGGRARGGDLFRGCKKMGNWLRRGIRFLVSRKVAGFFCLRAETVCLRSLQ